MIPQHGQLEISRGRLRHNVKLLRAHVGLHKTFCATVKANAYGHGVQEIAGLLAQLQVTWAAVYALQEAADLAGVQNVLVLAPVVFMNDGAGDPRAIQRLPANVRLNVTDEASARRLSTAVVATGRRPLKVHVQVDVGLTRAGVDVEHAPSLADLVASLPGLELEGIFGHFSHGDAAGHPATSAQVAEFHRIANPVKARHPGLMLHLQNSGGAWRVDDGALDMVRIGIAMYGLQPSAAEPIPGIQPVARVTAPLLAIHERPAGTGVGYGHTFLTQRASRIAVVPVGYADGYPRALSGRQAVAQVNGTDVPVVGRVSMDQITLDVTDVRAKVGDRVTLISWEPGALNSVDVMAETIATIGYEVATGFGTRLKRIIVN